MVKNIGKPITRQLVYAEDAALLDEMIPSNDSFRDKLHVLLMIMRDYEETMAEK